MAKKDLKNKPLAEAILELKWEIPQQPDVKAAVVALPAGDPHYRVLLGRFSDTIQKVYPAYESLPAAQLPDAAVAHTAQHRFRSSKDGWPLVQIGHGLMTVNDTEGYTWKDFSARAQEAVRILYLSHPAKDDFRIKNLMLRYINATEVNYESESIFRFLREKMGTNISLPDSLFSGGNINPIPRHFQWESAFPTEKPQGDILLKFATGKRLNNPAIVWETRVQTAGNVLSVGMPDEFSVWLTQSHDLIEDWFFKLISGDLETLFS